MKKLLLILLITTSLNAQTVINVPKINAIKYDKGGNFDFYHKTSDNLYQQINILFSRKENLINYRIRISDKKKQQNEILANDDTLVHIDDIFKKDINQLISNASFLFNDTHNSYDVPTRFILEEFSPQILSYSKIIYDKMIRGGFGGYEQHKDDDIKKWRLYQKHFYNKVIVNIANDKQIIILTDGSWQNEVFIPLKNNKANTIRGHVFEKKLAKNSEYSIKRKWLEAEKFYLTKKNAQGKSILTNNFDKQLLNKTFDSITFNNFYIIGKQKDKYSIYLTNLQLLPIENVKAVYFYRTGIEVLTPKGAHYYNENGEIVDKFPPITYTLCGTVSSTTYEIIKKNDDKFPHQISVREGYFSEDDFYDVYLLQGLKQNQNVSFLDNSVKFTWDGNDSFMESTYIQPNLLRVTENNKVGIVSYNSKKAKKFEEKRKKPDYYITKNGDTIIKTIPPLELNIKKLAKTTTVLPIEFDDIKLDDKDGLIYIYKNNKTGIYPQHKEPTYNSITPVTNHFYKIVKNGKQGWLDTQTFKEYFN